MSLTEILSQIGEVVTGMIKIAFSAKDTIDNQPIFDARDNLKVGIGVVVFILIALKKIWKWLWKWIKYNR